VSLGSQSLVALVGGVALGAAVAGRAGVAGVITSAAEVIGTLWINAILMTIVPLVVSKIVISVGDGHDVRALGQAGWRAATLMFALLISGAVMSSVLTPVLLDFTTIGPDASGSLRAMTAAARPAAGPPLPTFAQWLETLIPANAVRAAAEGAVLPLIIASLGFALALRKVTEPLRRPLVTLFRAVDATISVLLNWILLVSPVGICALAANMAARVGAGAIRALVVYVAVTSAVLVAFTLLLYPLVGVMGRVSIRRFAVACAPAQLVAFSTHSSLASLPAMLEGAATRLRLMPAIAGFILPFAVATFKYSSPIWFVTTAVFLGRLYDIPLDSSRAASVVFVAVITSFAVAGVPSGAAFVVLPVLLAAGLPPEAVGLLIAVDPIPNGFRTVANVTGDLALAAIIGDRLSRSHGAPRNTVEALAHQERSR
jgi:proton glutamate symport protein